MRPLAAGALAAVLLAIPAVAPAPADAPRPTVELMAPRVNSDISRNRTAHLSWSGRGGSGALRYRLEYRRASSIASRWRAIEPATAGLGARFRGRSGVTYVFRLRARDSSGVLSRYALARTVFPIDERARRLRFSPAWKRVRRPGAYGRTLAITARAGATAGMDFEGSRVLLMARRIPTGGRVLVRVDGRSRAVSLRGPARHRHAVFRSRSLKPGTHRLRLRSLGGRVNVDAVAVVHGPRPSLR